MVASGTVRKALDLTREDPRSGPLQGSRAVPDRPAPGRGGRRLRDAVHRRLGHSRKELHRSAPPAARGGPGIANLIQDLYDRGMDKDVVTVMWGEFGRSPKIGRRESFPMAVVTGRRSCPR